jgi:methionyl-tRNA formyltransferase
MNQKQNIKFAFFGTAGFSVAVLDELERAGFLPSAVVTAPDAVMGRKKVLTPSPVKVWAQARNIPVVLPDSLANFDLFVIASYGKIIPKKILDIPRFGTLNVHPSLLPKYRGPSPIQTFILNGDEETGVTIMLTDEQMDHGPVIASAKFEARNSRLKYKELE